MNSDTRFADDNSAPELDPQYEAMMREAETTGEAEERVGRDPLPRHDYHIGRLTAFKFKEKFEEKIPCVNIGLTVVEGVKGAVGKTYYDDLSLGWGETRAVTPGTKEDGLRPATDEEIARARKAVVATLQRFQRVFGLDSFLPPGGCNEEGVAAWLTTLKEQGENGPLVIFSGYTDKNGFTRIVWNSLRAPEDQAKDKRTKKPIEGKDAIMYAREQIALDGGETGSTDSGF